MSNAATILRRVVIVFFMPLLSSIIKQYISIIVTYAIRIFITQFMMQPHLVSLS